MIKKLSSIHTILPGTSNYPCDIHIIRLHTNDKDRKIVKYTHNTITQYYHSIILTYSDIKKNLKGNLLMTKWTIIENIVPFNDNI